MTSWLRRLRQAPGAAATLICFHHAGSGAASFSPWSRLLPDTIELACAQLPGRENRFRETPFRRMEPLVTALGEALRDELAEPYFFFGHSMGARVCFALTHHLRDLGRPLPRALFLSGTPAPSIRDWNHAHQLSDPSLIAHMMELGGVPDSVAAAPHFLQTFLPCLRADLEVSEVGRLAYPEPLTCPVHALAGRSDPLATPERVRAWREATTGTFTFRTFAGDHFFPQTCGPEVVEWVVEQMESSPGPPRTGGPAYARSPLAGGDCP